MTRTPEKQENQDRAKRPDNPHCRQIEEKDLNEGGGVDPRDGSGQDKASEGREKHNGCTRRADGPGLESPGAARRPDGMADAGKQVQLGKDREKDNEDATSRGENFQVYRRKNDSGIHVNHRAAKIIIKDEKSKRELYHPANPSLSMIQSKSPAIRQG
jgi:hypothetical protein